MSCFFIWIPPDTIPAYFLVFFRFDFILCFNFLEVKVDFHFPQTCMIIIVVVLIIIIDIFIAIAIEWATSPSPVGSLLLLLPPLFQIRFENRNTLLTIYYYYDIFDCIPHSSVPFQAPLTFPTFRYLISGYYVIPTASGFMSYGFHPVQEPSSTCQHGAAIPYKRPVMQVPSPLFFSASLDFFPNERQLISCTTMHDNH